MNEFRIDSFYEIKPGIQTPNGYRRIKRMPTNKNDIQLQQLSNAFDVNISEFFFSSNKQKMLNYSKVFRRKMIYRI